jgi:hypothetical protein
MAPRMGAVSFAGCMLGLLATYRRCSASAVIYVLKTYTMQADCSCENGGCQCCSSWHALSLQLFLGYPRVPCGYSTIYRGHPDVRAPSMEGCAHHVMLPS